MPALYPAAYAEFNRMLEELEPEIPHMKSEKARNFLTDQVARNKQYGERVFVSPAQLNWVKALHSEHIGDTDHDPGPREIDGRDPRSDEDMEDMSGQNREPRSRSAARKATRRKSDMDDDIPF